MVSKKMIGFIVALPQMYHTILLRVEKLIKIADKYQSNSYMGTIGDREDFTVKLVSVKKCSKVSELSGNMEIFYLYHVVDRLGNIGFFFHKQPPADKEPQGIDFLIIKLWDCFEMRATPKKQEPNKETGIKETQFSRIEITELIGPGTEE